VNGENSLHYVTGCEIQEHSIARLENITAVLPKVQVFWNFRPLPTSSGSLQGLQYYHFRPEIVIIFQGQFKTEDEDAGNYVITLKPKILQTLLFIKKLRLCRTLQHRVLGLIFIKPLLACSKIYIQMKIM
jgi:hypothetical protein